MGLFDVAISTAPCPHCAHSQEWRVQFEHGFCRRHEYRIGDSTNVFAEERYEYGSGPTGFTQAYGADFAPAKGWDLGGKFEGGKLGDALGGSIKRDVVSGTVGYTTKAACLQSTGTGAPDQRVAVWEHNRAWNGIWDVLPNQPSSYFPDHVYVTFFDDEYGLKHAEEIGVDNILFEMDFPHSDTNWPDSNSFAGKMVGALTPEQQQKFQT